MNVLKMYVQYVIDYIRFGLFGGWNKEEWSKKVLLDKFGKSLFCAREFQSCCHLSW